MKQPPTRGRLGRAARLARGVALDVSPVRASRDFRRLMIGETISMLGTQCALVALPLQIYERSHSPALVGLLGAFELGPMIVASLLGGAVADRVDRRRLLIAAQAGIVLAALPLAGATIAGDPPPALILILGGLLAGCSSLDAVTRASIIPRVVAPERLRSALAFSYGTFQLAGIAGPALGGALIAGLGFAGSYIVDAGSCVIMAGFAAALSPVPPVAVSEHPPLLRSITDGLRFVARTRALSGSFAIDLVAMTFGWPRAMLAVLSLTVFGAGSQGAGLLFAAMALGGTLSVLSAGWIERARRLGRIVIGVVVVWGVAIAGVGLARSLWLAMALLVVAGFADGVSAVCRSAINQTVTPDALRGRMSAVYNLVVTGGPRLGDVESGLVAGLSRAGTAVFTGGLACIAGAAVISLLFPELRRFDAERDAA